MNVIFTCLESTSTTRNWLQIWTRWSGFSSAPCNGSGVLPGSTEKGHLSEEGLRWRQD